MQPAILLLGRAREREDLRVAGVGRGVAERHRSDRRRPEDLVHEPESKLAHALAAQLGRQVRGPQSALFDLLLQRRDRLAQALEAELVPDRLQRPYLAPHEVAHPIQLLLEVGVRAEVPAHRRSFRVGGAAGCAKAYAQPRFGGGGLINATGIARPADRRSVAMRRPSCTAAWASPTC